jgi:hypothetical protein
MTFVLGQAAPTKLPPAGSTNAEPITYTGTGAEGNSFSVPGLAGKVLSQVIRQTGMLAITTAAAPNTSWIQYNPAISETDFTLSAGDFVGPGELFLFYYYEN